MYSINRKEFFIVAFTLALLCWVAHETPLDRILISPFYSHTAPHWPWKNSWIIESVIHKGGVKLIALTFIFALSFALFSKRVRTEQKYKIFLAHALLSTALSIALVALLKQITPILCPWNLTDFQGSSSFISLRQLFSVSLPAGHCFPAGHSSGAYAWISLYFSYQLVNGKRCYRWLLPGLLFGFLFGLAQQMRGAHFFSHDLATLLVCWATSGLMAMIFLQILKNLL